MQEELIALEDKVKTCEHEKAGLKHAVLEYEHYLRKIVDSYNN